LKLKTHLAKTLWAGLAAFAAATLALPAQAASNWPDRPIRLVIGYAPGGPVDTTARIFARYLGEKLGQAVVVENRSGASGIIGAQAVANAPPDGYMIYFAASPTMTMSPLVQKTPNFDPRKDFRFLGMIVNYTNVLLVGAQNPAKSVKDLVAAARSDPRAVSFGSAGIGSSNHLSAELLRSKSDVQMLHVPYRGNSPAMMDVISGKITFMFDITSTAIPFVQSGRARALAVTSRTRNSELPNVPTMIEAGIPDYELTGWYALVGPKALPDDIAQKLTKTLADVSADEHFKKAMLEGGYNIDTGGPAELQKRVADEYTLWDKVITAAHITAE
jgi:tripartite-type tricarboxylate transporter receptor subunit TctC